MMTIIRHKYEGQLGELIKDIRHLGLRVYFNLEHALVSLSEDDKILQDKSLRMIK